MGLSLDRLVFDPASPGDGSKVGSYLFSGDDGTAIGHVADAIKASITNASIVVTAVDLDIRNLLFATDKVDVGGSVIALDAASLAALESITVQNGAGASSVNIQDGGNSLTVDAIDLDIRNLLFATDKVDVSGSTVTASPFAGATSAYGATSVGVTATKIITANLASRKSVIVQNLGSKDMFFGHNNLITTINSIRLGAGQSLELAYGPTLDLYGITAAGTADVRYNEVA